MEELPDLYDPVLNQLHIQRNYAEMQEILDRMIERERQRERDQELDLNNNNTESPELPSTLDGVDEEEVKLIIPSYFFEEATPTLIDDNYEQFLNKSHCISSGFHPHSGSTFSLFDRGKFELLPSNNYEKLLVLLNSSNGYELVLGFKHLIGFLFDSDVQFHDVSKLFATMSEPNTFLILQLPSQVDSAKVEELFGLMLQWDCVCFHSKYVADHHLRSMKSSCPYFHILGRIFDPGIGLGLHHVYVYVPLGRIFDAISYNIWFSHHRMTDLEWTAPSILLTETSTFTFSIDLAGSNYRDACIRKIVSSCFIFDPGRGFSKGILMDNYCEAYAFVVVLKHGYHFCMLLTNSAALMMVLDDDFCDSIEQIVKMFQGANIIGSTLPSQCTSMVKMETTGELVVNMSLQQHFAYWFCWFTHFRNIHGRRIIQRLLEKMFDSVVGSMDNYEDVLPHVLLSTATVIFCEEYLMGIPDGATGAVLMSVEVLLSILHSTRSCWHAVCGAQYLPSSCSHRYSGEILQELPLIHGHGLYLLLLNFIAMVLVNSGTVKLNGCAEEHKEMDASVAGNIRKPLWTENVGTKTGEAFFLLQLWYGLIYENAILHFGSVGVYFDLPCQEAYMQATKLSLQVIEISHTNDDFMKAHGQTFWAILTASRNCIVLLTMSILLYIPRPISVLYRSFSSREKERKQSTYCSRQLMFDSICDSTPYFPMCYSYLWGFAYLTEMISFQREFQFVFSLRFVANGDAMYNCVLVQTPGLVEVYKESALLKASSSVLDIDILLQLQDTDHRGNVKIWWICEVPWVFSNSFAFSLTEIPLSKRFISPTVSGSWYSRVLQMTGTKAINCTRSTSNKWAEDATLARIVNTVRTEMVQMMNVTKLDVQPGASLFHLLQPPEAVSFCFDRLLWEAYISVTLLHFRNSRHQLRCCAQYIPSSSTQMDDESTVGKEGESEGNVHGLPHSSYNNYRNLVVTNTTLVDNIPGGDGNIKRVHFQAVCTKSWTSTNKLNSLIISGVGTATMYRNFSCYDQEQGELTIGPKFEVCTCFTCSFLIGPGDKLLKSLPREITCIWMGCLCCSLLKLFLKFILEDKDVSRRGVLSCTYYEEWSAHII